ncbi:ZIP family metal transporter [Pseudalkalibacillus hwajinpoensis]|uniref:ZIP family metal transporter n=1 Tax=Guptibacillus hwajinpoensis TaxID=208199 RepID=UPI00325B701C
MIIPTLINLFFIGFGGLILGSAAGLWAYTYYQHRLEALYLICGGMLIGVISLELIPESVQLFNFWALLVGVSLSLSLFICMDSALHVKFSEKSYLPLIAFVFAILSHNIPVGIALGMNSNSGEFGMALLLALFIHHLPEGVALYILTRISGINGVFVLVAACVVTIVLALSAWLGLESLQSNHVNGIFMGIAIGSLSYVAIHEIIGKVKGRVFKRELFLYTSLGILLLSLYLQISHKFF